MFGSILSAVNVETADDNGQDTNTSNCKRSKCGDVKRRAGHCISGVKDIPPCRRHSRNGRCGAREGTSDQDDNVQSDDGNTETDNHFYCGHGLSSLVIGGK